MKKVPSYTELSNLLVKLTEINITNIDSKEDQFVSCFTYNPAGSMPKHWKKAIEYRKTLMGAGIIRRKP